MEQADINAEVRVWQKHLSSINRKVEQNGTRIKSHTRPGLVQILVESVHDCYLALGHIHALWRPKDGRIKDFIATPKVNGYQSLHTTVFCLENQLAEKSRFARTRWSVSPITAWRAIGTCASEGERRLSTREMITWIEQLREWQRELPERR